jgi:tetratricopeptide (TPR) repeat protein
MILPLLLIQSGTEPPAATQTRFDACVAQAQQDPAAAERVAARWRGSGGGYLARQCEGIALANEQLWPGAAAAFEEAARGAEAKHDLRGANYWSQAGNAWLAAGRTDKARGALDAALAAGTLDGLARGEVRLDRARVLVATGDLGGARADLDLALKDAGADPLAWLLSATLARRMGDLGRAQNDIVEALKRSPDDASVHLERGNIAAARGDAAEATAGWREAMQVQPDSPAAASANRALQQFEGAEASKPGTPDGR